MTDCRQVSFIRGEDGVPMISHEQKKTLELYAQGLEHAEIAKRLHITPPGVSYRLQVAKKKMAAQSLRVLCQDLGIPWERHPAKPRKTGRTKMREYVSDGYFWLGTDDFQLNEDRRKLISLILHGYGVVEAGQALNYSYSWPAQQLARICVKFKLDTTYQLFFKLAELGFEKMSIEEVFGHDN